MFSLGKIQKKRQKCTLEVEPSLTPGLSVLFASTGKISVFLLKWLLMLQPRFSQISWATVRVNTLNAKQTTTQQILFVQHLTWNFKLCKFSYGIPVPTLAVSVVSKLQREAASRDTASLRSRSWRAGTCPRWGTTLPGRPRRWPGWPEGHVCPGRSLLRRWALPTAGPCGKSVFGGLKASQQPFTCAVMVKTNCPSLKVPRKSRPAGGDLLRFPYASLLPAQATPLFCLHEESFCLPELPFQVQSQLYSSSVSGTEGTRQRREMCQMKCCLLDAVTERWSQALLQRCSCLPAGGSPQPLLPTVKLQYNIKYIHLHSIYWKPFSFSWSGHSRAGGRHLDGKVSRRKIAALGLWPAIRCVCSPVA